MIYHAATCIAARTTPDSATVSGQSCMSVVNAVLGEPVPMEIERKYLIEMPDVDTLFKNGAVTTHIVQVYLKSKDNVERRIRMREADGGHTFYYTEKTAVSGMERMEKERRISAEEYFDLLREADTALHTVVKDRYCFTYSNQYFELDMYQDNSTSAILEIELTDKADTVDLPPWLTVIKDVTEDDYYKNHQIAKRGKL